MRRKYGAATACRQCTGTCNQGRDCSGSAAVSRATLIEFTRWLGPYLAAVLIALLLASAPVFLDGQGPTPRAGHSR